MSNYSEIPNEGLIKMYNDYKESAKSISGYLENLSAGNEEKYDLEDELEGIEEEMNKLSRELMERTITETER